MPNPPPNSPYLRLGLLLALALTAAYFAYQNLFPEPPPAPGLQEIPATVDCDGEATYVFAEEWRHFPARRPKLPPPEVVTLPQFPGCESVEDYEERVFCSFSKLREFIQGNLDFPPGAEEGIVIASFSVGKDTGKLQNEEIVIAPNRAMEAEALRVLRIIKERDIRFTPGTIRGQPACLRLNMPIVFK